MSMKSIKQLNEENDLKNVITAFTKLIGLAKLSKKVNFKRKSVVSLTAVISWFWQLNSLAIHFTEHRQPRTLLLELSAMF